MAGAAKTVFLDRDGVINKKALEGEYITKWSSFEFLPHVFNAIKILKNAGYKVIVVTNQRGVALHKMSMDDVDNIHRQMIFAVREYGADIDAVYVCPHQKGTCNCRKPKIGLFLKQKRILILIDLPVG